MEMDREKAITDRMKREKAITNLHRLSKHYALSDDWQNFCKEVAGLLADDQEEIKFLKDVFKEILDDPSLSKVGIGRIVRRNLPH